MAKQKHKSIFFGWWEKMSMQVFSIDNDDVIKSCYATCKTTYAYALGNVVPLMQKLSIQRKVQSPKFYDRLADDIVNGCIMPPLTLAFVESNIEQFSGKPSSFFEKYINANIKSGFVLDGIQRLNTLKRISDNKKFKPDSSIFFNVLICPSNDKLLYRMITLNNGQKPMTARHQVEILLGNIYQFKGEEIEILSEKEATGGKARGSFKKASFINAYLAFLSDATNIDNKKIIEDKLDELLATRIIERGTSDTTVEFINVIGLVSKFSQVPETKKWFQNENHLIGFSVAMRQASVFNMVSQMSPEIFAEKIEFFDDAFSNADVSQFRVSNYRRKLAHQYFINLNKIDKDSMGEVEALAYLLDKID